MVFVLRKYNLRKLNNLYKEVVEKSDKYFPQPTPKPKEYRNIKYMVDNPKFADKTVNELRQMVDDSQRDIAEWKVKRQKEVSNADKKFLTALTNCLVSSGIIEDREIARQFSGRVLANNDGIKGAMEYVGNFVKMLTGKSLGDS